MTRKQSICSNLSLTLLICILHVPSYGQQYKHLMKDYNVNFYDVVEEAETYFLTHKKEKSSGWKPYQRWLHENEYKYFPSGDLDKLFYHAITWGNNSKLRTCC